jgi:UDP:flavonoid glycosyltransferase YjiC (YdhE family)
MRYVISAGLGAAGEVLPFIAVGAQLRQRGHHVTFVGNPYYLDRAAKEGLLVSAVGTIDDYYKFASDTALFGAQQKSAVQVVEDYYYPFMNETYRALTDAAGTGPAVIIGNDVVPSAVAEKHGLPRVQLVLAPSRFASRYDPPHPTRVLPTWARWFAGSGKRLSLLWRLRNLRRGQLRWPRATLNLPGNHPINVFRASVGLPDVNESYAHAGLILALWPEWFGAPQADWPENAVATGFPMHLRSSSDRAGLAEPICDNEASRPIVATTGSVANAQENFFAAVVAAARMLGRPSILVTPHQDQLPPNLPPDVTYLDYAPFDRLFDRAALVVHHGGIGTTAYALAAGVPQLVVPMRGEQFDIANRAARLGVARMLSVGEMRPENLAQKMRVMLRSQRVTGACTHWRSRLESHDGLRRAADLIEQFASDTFSDVPRDDTRQGIPDSPRTANAADR